MTLKAFKYILFGFCLALFVSVRSFGDGGAPRQVEGVVKASTTWSGTVLVVNDVYVPEGVTLTIAPGTRVLFVSRESSKFEPFFISMQTEIMVRGVLLAQGTEKRPIEFDAAPEDLNTKKPERGDWGGIIFDGREAGGSRIENASFHWADCAVTALNSSPSISGCTISDCRYGILSMGGSAPAVVRSVITGGEYGIVSGRGSKPAIESSSVEKNGLNFILRD